MSFLKLVKLAKKFEAKLQKEGQALKYVTGPGQSMMIDPSQVQLPPEPTEHDKLLSRVPPPVPGPKEINVPEQTIEGNAPVRANPNVKSVQNYINQELAVKNQLISPIKSDGIWGRETVAALQKWLKLNNLNLDLNKGFAAALVRAMGQENVNSIDTVQQPNLKSLV